MATIVRGHIPAEEFTLYEALSSISDVEFEVEQIVESGEDAVMPLLWVRGATDETIQETFDADHSVRDLSPLAEFEHQQLYRMEWITEVELVLQMLTNSAATITDAFGEGDDWYLRVLYPSRGAFGKTMDYCDENDLTFNIDGIRQMEGEPAGRFGLTDGQYRAVVAAADAGYYKIPREVNLQDLAEKLGMSHQALSERLRRGMDALVEDTLLIGPQSDDREKF